MKTAKSKEPTKSKKATKSAKQEPPYEFEYISSDKLEVLRDAYQKPLNKRRVAQIVANFDENIANEPKVNFRDGHYYVFDGQHTYAALVLMNGGEPLLIRCKVYRDLTKEQEAMLFAAQTGFAAKPTPANRLRAMIYAGDPEAIAFRDATERAGLLLDPDGVRSKNHILCINTCLQEFRRVGAEAYTDALSIISTAWDGAPDSLLGDIIIGVIEFVVRYKNLYNDRQLVSRLSKVSPRELYKSILADFNHPGRKKNLYSIYKIYNVADGGPVLPMKF